MNFKLRSADILIFEGQGTTTSHSSQAIQNALLDAKKPIGYVLLSACHSAFLQELSEADQSGIDIHRIQTPTALLDVYLACRTNAIIANTSLYLIQVLRFLANVDPCNLGPVVDQHQSTPSSVLGFSSGLLAATVVAASSDIATFLTNAVEAFRLAFWIGYETQRYADATLSALSGYHSSSPWSLVLFGPSRYDAANAVQQYSQDRPNGPQVYLTAVTNDKCVSISGRPDAIVEFRTHYMPLTTDSSQFAPLHTLYHAQTLESVKRDVMTAIVQRNIRFPSFDNLERPIRSTINGALIDRTHRGPRNTLVESIVDMILLHPVNFDFVVGALHSDIAARQKENIRLINLGPGRGLWRSMVRSMRDIHVSAVDWSSTAEAEATPTHIRGALFQKRRGREPIAIVGMAVNFPSARDVAGLWGILENGLNTVSEIPDSRFNVGEFIAAQEGWRRTLKTRYGNFVENADVFDNTFFRVSPREARSMDPQQRVLLHVGYHALENAGYVPSATPSFNPETFATYVGVATNDYVHNLRNDMDVYYSTGTLQAFLSGKLSYAFGFGGPSIVIDTACSSSVVAIYQACRALENGDCNAALAGGVHVMSSPDMYMGLDRAHLLSPTGQCRPWDASADGYCRSEGCGMFVLKRLSDALSENDRILGVIRGVEVNQSGQADSITHPHVETQVRLFEKLLASTGIHPHRVSVIEAHGTGTQAGDPAELESLRRVFAIRRPVGNPLHVTSMKANIGHAEAASGAASLAKLVLMMRERRIPVTISLKQLNPRIPDLATDNVRINTEATSWEPPDGQKRLALLNNFGAAGSNSALILEEPPVRHASSSIRPLAALVLGLSCESKRAAEHLRQLYIQALCDSDHDQTSLVDFAYTATARRQLYKYRIAASGRSAEELCANLRAADVVLVDKAPPKVVFAFSGQGTQYAGMGSGLYGHVSSFRWTVDSCNDKLVARGFPSILSIIRDRLTTFPGPGDAESMVVSQCAIFVLEYALATLWMSWGIRPDVVAGHSLGEYAALAISGVVKVDDALLLVAQRAKLMSTKCTQGLTGMLAIRSDPSTISQILDRDPAYQGLSVACFNSNTDCVVAGNTSRLDLLQRYCEQSEYRCVRVDVPYGYHSPAMDPVLDDLRMLGHRVDISPPSIPVLSGVLGVIVCDGSRFSSEYFARHCREPVRFQQGIQDLLALENLSGNAVWIEIGPHPTTLQMLRGTRAERHLCITSLRKTQTNEETLCTALSRLYSINTSISWRKVYTDLAPEARLIDLPAYPFADTRFWVPYEENNPHRASQAQDQTHSHFSLLGTRIHPSPTSSGCTAVFEINMGQFADLVEGHKVAGHALCPASVYHELALAATKAFLEDSGDIKSGNILELTDVIYEKSLVYSPGTNITVRAEVVRSDCTSTSFRISSWLANHELCHSHCSGTITKKTVACMTAELSSMQDMVHRHRRSVSNDAPGTRTFYSSRVYELFSRVVEYSDAYRTIKSVTVHSNGVDSYALVQSPSIAGPFIVHPIFMDTLLHVAGFVLNYNASEDEAFICSQIDSIRALPDLIKTSAMYGVYCKIGFLSEASATVDAYAIELDGKDPAGRVIAHMNRIRFRKLNVNSFRNYLSSTVRDAQTIPSQPAPILHRGVLPVTQGACNDLTLQQQIIQIVADSCCIPISNVTMQSRLDELGVDSLMSIELASRIKAVVPSVQFEACAFGAYQRVQDLVQHLMGRVASGSAMPTPSIEVPCSPDGEVEDNKLDALGPTMLSEKVKEVLSAILGIPTQDLSDTQELGPLGLDSLTSIEARRALRSALGIHLPEDIFASCKTVRDFTTTVVGTSARAASRSEHSAGTVSALPNDNPIPLQQHKGTDAVPLFLIHDGSGMVHPYSRLSDLGRWVWGIQNPKFSTGEQWDGGVLEMAAHYAKLIRAATGDTECIIGGWSFGGVVAYEVARQLVASGVRIAGIVLIDSPHPRMRSPLPSSLIDTVIDAKIPSEKHAALVRTQMRHATEALVDYDPLLSPASHVCSLRAVMLRSEDAYPLATIDCESASFLADRADRSKSVREWETLLGTAVPILDIPGNHFEPFDPNNVATVSDRLREALAMLDRASS